MVLPALTGRHLPPAARRGAVRMALQGDLSVRSLPGCIATAGDPQGVDQDRFSSVFPNEVSLHKVGDSRLEFQRKVYQIFF